MLRHIELVGLVLTVIGGTAAALARATETPTADHRQVEPFDLWQVRLLDGPFRDAMERQSAVLAEPGQRSPVAHFSAHGRSAIAREAAGRLGAPGQRGPR